jgi:hypothetical protein
MRTYRVYAQPNAKVPVVVKVGFSWLAFFIGPLWFLVSKMWIEGFVYTALLIGSIGFHAQGLGPKAMVVLWVGYLAVWFLVAQLAHRLYEENIRSRGYKLLATVAAKGIVEAREYAAQTVAGDRLEAAPISTDLAGTAVRSAAFIVSAIAITWLSVSALIYHRLSLVVDANNRSLPQQLDADTRLDGSFVRDWDSIEAHLTLVNMESSQVSGTGFADRVKRMVLARSCSLTDTLKILDMGASLVYVYYSNDKVKIASVTLDRASCGLR